MSDEKPPHERSVLPDGGAEPFTESDSTSGNGQNGTAETQHATPEISQEMKREFLQEVVRRQPLLRTLESEPADPSALLDSVDMARSTLHRAINSLQEYDIVEEDDGAYELTGLGEIVARETAQYDTRTVTALSLRGFLNCINTNGDGIPIEHFVDAEITQRRPRQPHATIHRITELIESAENLRMFSTVISPVYVDVGYREMMNGTSIEAIFDREVIDIMISEYPEKANETISTGNFDIYAHDGLPFELFLLEDRVGMAAHNDDGIAEVLIECGDPSAIEWAEDLYSKHLSQAKSMMMSDF